MTAANDRDALRAKLQDSAGPVQGSDLAAHLRRDAVLVVAPSAPLVERALAVACDDARVVAAWLTSGVLRRPEASERDAWPTDTDRRWMAVVVQPFVIVQPLALD
jgi:hypothetical protein